MLPLLLRVKTPFLSVMGLNRFATHTTVLGLLLYHIPRYLLFELPGEKKPSSNLREEETNVSPSEMDCPMVMVSPPNENSMTDMKDNR